MTEPRTTHTDLCPGRIRGADFCTCGADGRSHDVTVAGGYADGLFRVRCSICGTLGTPVGTPRLTRPSRLTFASYGDASALARAHRDATTPAIDADPFDIFPTGEGT
jgi:hypothetical protein